MHILSARETRLEAARRRKVAEIISFLQYLLLCCQKKKRENATEFVREPKTGQSVASQLVVSVNICTFTSSGKSSLFVYVFEKRPLYRHFFCFLAVLQLFQLSWLHKQAKCGWGSGIRCYSRRRQLLFYCLVIIALSGAINPLKLFAEIIISVERIVALFLASSATVQMCVDII